MKRLYICDLDGTLLSPEQLVTEETVRLLNESIAKGAFFTFATARTAASAVKITEGININVPCILMNGVSVYDIARKKYVKNEYLPAEKSAAVAELLDSLGQSGFMYKISEDKLSCEYTTLDSPEIYEFYRRRKDRYDKPFAQIKSFSDSCTDEVMYFTMLDRYEKLDAVRKGAEKIGGLKYEFYRDIYSENVWYLEIFSDRASKYNGVKFLREYCGFEHITCFGDNLNDIPMFRASDVKLAVGNAKPELKELADEIILPNTENGVAVWLSENYI
ncbi:MAG: HAD family phosphatase [Ruminococcus sp.]|nr:HAD family phosphatase [Ruminococcus sp.]